MKEKIKKILANNPKGLTQKEISEKLGVSNITAAKFLAYLEGAKEVDVRSVGKAKLYYLKLNGFEMASSPRAGCHGMPK